MYKIGEHAPLGELPVVRVVAPKENTIKKFDIGRGEIEISFANDKRVEQEKNEKEKKKEEIMRSITAKTMSEIFNVPIQWNEMAKVTNQFLDYI